jgi:hypothetical protein
MFRPHLCLGVRIVYRQADKPRQMLYESRRKSKTRFVTPATTALAMDEVKPKILIGLGIFEKSGVTANGAVR